MKPSRNSSLQLLATGTSTGAGTSNVEGGTNDESRPTGKDPPTLPSEGSHAAAAASLDYFHNDRFALEESLKRGLDKFFERFHENEECTSGSWYDDCPSGPCPSLRYCCDDEVLKFYQKWKRHKGIQYVEENMDIPGMVGFSKQIDQLLRWEGGRYVGPFFCYIPPWTRDVPNLMNEYRKVSPKNRMRDGCMNTVTSCLIVSPGGWNRDQDGVFPVDLGNNLTGSPAAAAEWGVFQTLDTLLAKIRKCYNAQSHNIVLFFDESHSYILLDRQFGLEAFVFRCVRKWLRQVRDELAVVAVFAARDMALTRCYLQDDEIPALSAVPAYRPQPPKRRYFGEGRQFYPTLSNDAHGIVLNY
jgi:hypothetical protein